MSGFEVIPIVAAASSIFGLAIFGGENKKEHYGDDDSYPPVREFYAKKNKKAPLSSFKSPSYNKPSDKQKMDMANSGDQLLTYQLYQQSINSATPTLEQLNSISGQSQEQMGRGELEGGTSADTAPYAMLNDGGPPMYASEFQAVNLGSERAKKISACAQNAPSFMATSLLPKPAIPGQQAWDVDAPNNILANQNFLSAQQQIGVDTVLSSTRNQSYDIRGNPAPNPIRVVSPWNNTSLMPDLERRPLQCGVPRGQGLYGCGDSNTYLEPTYVEDS